MENFFTGVIVTEKVETIVYDFFDGVVERMVGEDKWNSVVGISLDRL